MEWRLIETAPKDGTPVLLFARHVNATASVRLVGHYINGKWHALSFYDQEPAPLVPSHWMLLPDFPKESA